MSRAIEDFVTRSAELTGRVVHERPIWNSAASGDAIRHYCYGTSDGNPLWLDPAYGRNGPFGRSLAPPGFICSVLYPFLHGAATDAALLSLIGSISVEWYAHIFEGDTLRAEAVQGEVSASFDRAGRAIALVPAETVYRNQQDAIVARAQGTMVRIERRDEDLFLDRSPTRYSDLERAAMDRALRSERRSGIASPARDASLVGSNLPTMMRGPLSIGDLICWQAAIGPSYRSGLLGYFDALKSPHTTVRNPITGWPLKYSQQHEDFEMAAQRGMPAPFDNSLMRFAWIIPMLTDWMGDEGFLRKLTIDTGLPLIYGDATWYRAVVWDEKVDRSRNRRQLELRITGVNQLGQTTTTGSASLELPLPTLRAARSTHIGQRNIDGEPASIYDQIAAHAAAKPGAAAIVFEDKEVSFAALLGSAGAIANLLRDRAGGSEVTLVALIFERSVEAIAAMLAVMRLGSGVLCIDPNEPETRLRDIIEAARPDVILTDPRSAGCVPTSCGGSGIPHVVWEGGGSPSVSSGVERTGALAYVMTTSGSMGRPKCVAVSQNSLRTYVSTLREAFGYAADDRFLHTASLSFSAAIRQTFAPLCSGATLVLASEAERRDPALLFDLMKRQAVSIWDTVPTVWQAAIDFLDAFNDRERTRLLDNGLRSIFLTGEPLRWRTPRMWRALGGRGKVINLYSQTETAGTVAAYVLPESLGSDDAVVPVGRPLPDCEILLEANTETGEQEICVSSPRLASGYLGDPEATTDEFPNRPFHEAGYRRTGDTGLWTDDGLLVVTGRLGLVTKIRGQQVSLSAVESVLAARPEITEAAVACHEWQGARQLVAYVVAREQGPALEDILLQSVLESLGPAAVPARILLVQQLPATRSGKLDRSKLSLPAEWVSPDATETGGLPDTEVLGSIREIVSDIFCRSLSRQAIGPERDFFSLGGNSLMATRIVAQIRKAFSIELSMKEFFDAPTIEGVSRATEALLLADLG